jgi:hypothetical protein
LPIIGFSFDYALNDPGTGRKIARFYPIPIGACAATTAVGVRRMRRPSSRIATAAIAAGIAVL